MSSICNVSPLHWLFCLLIPGTPMRNDEIQPGELCRYAFELKAAVDAICKGPTFRTSAKSCQFLRYIVQHTLDGKVDELKERLIGIVLLGRQTSYDTGSDAGVRVRANDVRKRLAAYYAANSSELEFTLDLPAGSYVPRFYMLRDSHGTESDAEVSVVAEPHHGQAMLPEAPYLSLQLLALPTLVALFLCVICIRWQLTREQPFVSFWNAVFQDHHALLYVPNESLGGQQEVCRLTLLKIPPRSSIWPASSIQELPSPVPPICLRGKRYSDFHWRRSGIFPPRRLRSSRIAGRFPRRVMSGWSSMPRLRAAGLSIAARPIPASIPLAMQPCSPLQTDRGAQFRSMAPTHPPSIRSLKQSANPTPFLPSSLTAFNRAWSRRLCSRWSPALRPWSFVNHCP